MKDSAFADRVQRIALPVAAAVVVLVLWHTAVGVTHSKVFPAPGAVLRGLGELWRRRVLLPSLRDSMGRVAAGYLLASIVGVPLGILMGSSRAVATVMNPVIQILRPISPIAWIPVAIVLFGIGRAAPVFLVTLGAFFPIVTSAATAVAGIPDVYLRAGRNFGLSPLALMMRIVLPATLPQILAGLRIALGIAWLVLVAAEMIAVDSGLGYLIIDARNAGQRYDLVVAGMLLIGLVGLALDAAMQRLERLRFLRWSYRPG